MKSPDRNETPEHAETWHSQPPGSRHPCVEITGAVLDLLPYAIWVVETGAQIVYANRAGIDQVAFGRVLYRSGNRLTARDGQIERWLRNGLETARHKTDRAVQQMISGGPDTDRLAIWIAPLSTHAPSDLLLDHVVVAARHMATFEARYVATAACQFGLTAAETRVAEALLNGESVATIAEKFGLAITTVKTHLGRIFAKTGTRGQSDLIRLLAGMRPPITPRPDL